MADEKKKHVVEVVFLPYVLVECDGPEDLAAQIGKMKAVSPKNLAVTMGSDLAIGKKERAPMAWKIGSVKPYQPEGEEEDDGPGGELRAGEGP